MALKDGEIARSSNADEFKQPVSGEVNGEVKDYNSKTDEGLHSNRTRIFKTFALACLFLMMGLASPLLGATAVHLENLFQVDAETVSMSMIVSATGSLVGSIACALVYDRTDSDVSFAAVNVSGAMFAVACCFAANFTLFKVLVFFNGLAFGFDGTAAQSYCVGLWNGHRLKKSILQGMHGLWSLGGVFGPMIIKPFLCELESRVPLEFTTPGLEAANATLQPATDGIVTDEARPRVGDCVEGSVETGRYAFLTMGIIAGVCSLPFVALGFRSLALKRKETADARRTKSADKEMEVIESDDVVKIRPETSDAKRSRSIVFTAVHYVIIFVFTMLNMYAEFVPVLFLLSFAMKHLGWSVMHSSLLLSVYFGAHFAGRIAGVLNSLWLSPVKMLSFNLALTTTAYLLLLLAVNRWPSVAWVGAAVAGFGVSTTFPTTVLWVSETTPLTGRLSAALIVGMCSGAMTAPYLVGFLMAKLDQMWFVYALVLASSSSVLVFLVEFCFVRSSSSRLLSYTSQF